MIVVLCWWHYSKSRYLLGIAVALQFKRLHQCQTIEQGMTTTCAMPPPPSSPIPVYTRATLWVLYWLSDADVARYLLPVRFCVALIVHVHTCRKGKLSTVRRGSRTALRYSADGGMLQARQL